MRSRDTQYCRGLHHAAMTINSTLEVQEVLRTIAKVAAETLDAKACSLLLLSPDRRRLYHSAAYGLSDWYIRKGPVNVDQSMTEAIEGRPVCVYDAGSDPRVQYGPQNVKEGIASILSVPVRLRGDVIGVLRVYTGEPREFLDEEVDFAEALSELGAIALENARRHETIKKSYDALCQDLLEWYGAGQKPISMFNP